MLGGVVAGRLILPATRLALGLINHLYEPDYTPREEYFALYEDGRL